CRMIRGPAEAPEAFEYACRNIGSRGIDHRVVVGKRNVAEKRFVVVAVKSAPAAVAVLHAEQPLNTSAHRSLHALGGRKLHPLQGHEYERGVVHVRIKIIAK